MRKILVSALVASLLLLVLSAVSATPITPDYSKIGVEVGDIAIYRYSHPYLTQNRIERLFYGIVGTAVSFNDSIYYPDGSELGHSWATFDVKTGSYVHRVLTAADLTTGNPIYPGAAIVINETVQKTVAGALRTLNHARFDGGLTEYFWDQATGLMTAYCVGWGVSQEIALHAGVSHSARDIEWTNYTLLSTTAWAPDTAPRLLNMTTIVLAEGLAIILLVIVLIVLATRPRRR